MSAHATGIPVLSLKAFKSQDGSFARDLGRAWREFGFVGITDHDIDDALIEQAYSVFRAFFALPQRVKRKYHQPGSGGARGYTGFGIEQARSHNVPDLKEFWHVGRELNDDNPYPGVLHPNIWPDEVPDFRTAALAMYRALERLGNRLLSAAALDLGLDRDWFSDKTRYGNSILRPLHYPPIGQAPEGAVRAAEHEDINLITLLVGSREQGLEILNRKGTWVPVTTLPGTIIVNVGDMLQRLTNHVYPSTTHRVVNPPGAAAGQSRYSIPFFLHPNPDFVIRTLPGCAGAGQPDRYPEPITANDYLRQRLKEIRLL
ncbi:isopenicillin N synthase family oxygenase [Wenzhouxiangella sp. AB-CW3]|uniref:isopenicillin N synthase family dioxygenase n=1 Tax=Wenzhouxiangella sp. AB-CW3 TaxID=2771012 RepID=UPI00168B37BA|nr:isopenicillin N synthase family oxygenase [Wenzhouxiangella sp. AB-CW3]QOC23682.1 isopenicillin N synthase family oxygenase [Wenzhouxiangella sp. AB-CW3]